MITSLLAFIVTLIFLIITVHAQTDNELITTILRVLLGDLPQPCSTLGSATCTYCIGYLKLLPLLFFFGFFYLMFFIITFGIRGRVQLSNIPSIHIAVLIIAALLSIFLLHTPLITSALTRVESFMNWINWGLSLLSFMLAYTIANRLFGFFMGLITHASTLIPELGTVLNSVFFQITFRLLFTILAPFAIMLYVRSQLPDTDVGNWLFGETSKVIHDAKICVQ